MKSKKKLIIVSAASSAVGIGAIVGVSTWIATHKPKEIARGGNPINKDDEPGDKKYEIIDSNSGNIIDFDAVFNNKQNVDLPEQRIKSSHFINKNTKIKYVAIGDSITAGFDGTLEKDYKGSFENGLVTGLSYPSYLSRLFNKINRLESFDNYSVTGSTINEWIDLLQLSTNPKDLVSESSLISRFGKDYKLLAKEIIKQLKESNFITLSIGANDFIHTFIDAIKQSGITQSIQLILNDNPTFGPLIEDVKKILDSSIKEVSRRLQVFASEIKKLAPNANINFISYPTPFLKLKYMIDNFVKNFAGDIAKDFSITDFFTGILNNTIKLNANRNGINFINPVNNQFWNKNAQKISSIWFDIHPNTNGYKKLAIDLFIKLTNPSLIIDDYQKIGDFNFSTDFLKSDYQTATYQ
ncbi:GDSL-type esterase/lipase family protein, partial [Mycoplasmopsis anatis]